MAGLIKSQTIQEAIGTVKEFAGSSAPTKWLICNGTAISRTIYADLFALIGTTYGAGDGSTTFNIPDFQGRSPKGVGTSNGGTDVTHVAESITLGLKQNDRTQGHIHNEVTTAGANKTVVSTVGTGSIKNGIRAGYDEPIGNFPQTESSTPVTDGVNGTPRTGNITTGKCLGVNFIIKAVI